MTGRPASTQQGRIPHGYERFAAHRAPRQAVWEALNDPDVLKQCIPGCQDIEKSSPTEMTAKAVLKIGPVKASFAGKVTLSDLDPPKWLNDLGRGRRRRRRLRQGWRQGSLEADGEDATILSYDVKADVGGKIAQLGARLIDGTARSWPANSSRSSAPWSPPPPCRPGRRPAKKGWFGTKKT